MTTRATLFLVAVLAALCAAYWITGRMNQAAEQQAVEARRLFDFKAQDIVTLSVTRTGEVVVEAMRDDSGRWSIIAPFDHIEADLSVWNRVAGAVASLLNERTIEENPDDKTLYGLDPPSVSVIAGTSHGELVQINVGSLEPTQTRRYAQIGSGPIVLISLGSHFEMDRSLSDLRERRIVPFGDAGLRRIEYARFFQGIANESQDRGDDNTLLKKRGDESTVVAFEKDTDGQWRMREPQEIFVIQDRVNKLSTELQFLMGRDYVDDPESLADYGLDVPVARLTSYSVGTNEELTFFIGWVADQDEKGGVFAKLKDNRSVFVIDGHILSLLPRGPRAFADTRIFTRQALLLKDIHYRDTKSDFRLSYDHDTKAGWQLSEAGEAGTDHAAVSAYIAALKNMHSEPLALDNLPQAPSSAEELARFGFATPHISIEFRFKDEDTKTSILVGSIVDGSDPLSQYIRDDTGNVGLLPVQGVLMLQAEPFDFQPKELFAFDTAQGSRLDVEFEGIHYQFAKTAGTWTVVAPEKRKFENPSDVAAFLEILSAVKATGILNFSPSAHVHGLDSPSLLVTVYLGGIEGQTQQRFGTLEVGNLRASGSRERFARVSSRENLFYVDQSIIDDMREAFRGIVYVDE